jgi:DNA-binding transcriptional MerR regulator
MFQVGEVSRRLGLNTQTLYFYERIGLIPNPRRTAAGYRLYDQPDLERLSFITQAKTLGLSLDEIKELLKMQEGQQLSCQDVHDRLLKKVQDIDDTIAKLQALRAQLTPILDRCQRSLSHPQSGQDCVVFQQHLPAMQNELKPSPAFQTGS